MDLDIEPAWNPGDANMNIEEFRGLVEKRRSTRGYDENRAVSDDMIKTILDCARWAPSGGNGQPWEFVIVRNRAVRHKIADFYMKQLEQKREMDLAVRGTAKMTGDGFRHAPVHIIVLGDPRVKEAYPIRTKLEKAESHFITGFGQRDIADSFGGGFAGSGVSVRERRKLALHGDNAQSAV
ncbi:MAG: nitroreductase family protein, partial [Candidatus Binatia bacterium]